MSDLSIPNTIGGVISAAPHNQNYSAIQSYINARNAGSTNWDSLGATVGTIGSLTATTATVSTLNVTGNTKMTGPRPWVDVLAYGAVGDGTTNCTAAFNSAVAAASGGQVIIPAGTYKIDGQIAIGISNVKIIGIGTPILKQYDTNSYTFVTGTGIKDVEIAGVGFSSDTATGGSGSAIQFNISNLTPVNERIRIHDCYFGSTLNMIGIGCGGVVNLMIHDNVFEMGSEAQHGLYLTDSVNVQIRGNKFVGPGASSPTFPSSIGIKVVGCYDTFIDGNYITNWQDDGIVVSHQSGTNYPIRTTISNNIIYSITKSGGTGISVAEATDTTISNNIIRDALNAGIIAESAGMIITGNHIYDCGTSGGTTQDGMDVSGSNIIVSGNTMSNFVAFGVAVGSATSGYVSISDNIISGNSAGRGVSINSGSTAAGIISGNILVGVTSAHILNSKDYVIRGNRLETAPLTDSATKLDSVVLGIPTSGDQGLGTLNAAASVYKNAVAYTNP